MNKVTFPIQQGEQGSEVETLHKALLFLLDKAKIFPDDQAARTEFAANIQDEVAEQKYDDFTVKLIFQFQQENQLPNSGNVDRITAIVINDFLSELGVTNDDVDENKARVVRGHIINELRQGLKGYQVILLDKGLGDTQDELGKISSGNSGEYEIRYTYENAKKEAPDIQVKVIDEQNQILAKSRIIYNAKPFEGKLDVLITAEKLPQLTEIEQLNSELNQQMGNLDEPDFKKQIAAIKEDDEQQDLTYLANKSGWDARMVAMTSLANQFSAQSKVEPEFYYALFRAGVPTNQETLNRLDGSSVKQIWINAIEAKILPKNMENKIPDNITKLKQHSAVSLIQEDAQAGLSSFKELIGLSIEDENEQIELANLYLDTKQDLDSFWEKTKSQFGEEKSDKLQLNARLAQLTTNNVPLIKKLYQSNQDLKSPVNLIEKGYYQASSWETELDAGIEIPSEILGEGEEQKSNYAAFMANQLRLSYPTAVISDQIKNDVIPLKEPAANKTLVTDFLNKYQGEFELGVHPVKRFLLTKKDDHGLSEQDLKNVGSECTRLQRTYQFTLSDEMMVNCLNRDLDSAFAVTRYDNKTFINKFKDVDGFGGEENVKMMYAKAEMISHNITNVAAQYRVEQSYPKIHAIDGLHANAVVNEPVSERAATMQAIEGMPTMEEIFGELDYCDCEHCRSWLSPAAYLVELLQFLDSRDIERGQIPLDVCLQRRPDIQYIQLSCENTNTVLPYVDLVNEILEHHVINNAIDGFMSHNIEDGVSTEDLLASPQFVETQAYNKLKDDSTTFPLSLPFHQPLEALRKHIKHFDLSLHQIMEALRPNDDKKVEEDDINEAAYGWNDILMERLSISRQEYRLLTQSDIGLQNLYGENEATVTLIELIGNLETVKITTDDDHSFGIGNAKLLSKKLGVNYQQIIDIVQTRFINPESHLLTKLKKLEVNVQVVIDFLDDNQTEAQFLDQLPGDFDHTAFGGNLIDWLRDNEQQIKHLILLAEPIATNDVCSFDTVELRYVELNPADDLPKRLEPIEFLKIARFVRLWRKLGWTIQQTDKAICALYPVDKKPELGESYDQSREKLDSGFTTLLIRLAHFVQIKGDLNISGRRELDHLLACWSDINVKSEQSLYQKMFLNPTILKQDDVFADDGYDNYMADKVEFEVAPPEPPKVKEHIAALRAAFNLTEDEFDLIYKRLWSDEEKVLNFESISLIFRYGFFARKLRLSFREFFALIDLSGLDPFNPLDLQDDSSDPRNIGLVKPAAILFLELFHLIKDSPLDINQLNYLVQHKDHSKEIVPLESDIRAIVKTIHDELNRIDLEYKSITDDPDGTIAREKMALLYGAEDTEFFIGLLKRTHPFEIEYSHPESNLKFSDITEEELIKAVAQLSYDHLGKKLIYRGRLPDIAVLENLSNKIEESDQRINFKNELFRLKNGSELQIQGFFNKHRIPIVEATLTSGAYNLEAVFDEFSDSENLGNEFLARLLPSLMHKNKLQVLGQTLNTTANIQIEQIHNLLSNTEYIHASKDAEMPMINDYLALQDRGWSVIMFEDDPEDSTSTPVEVVNRVDSIKSIFSTHFDPTPHSHAILHGYFEPPVEGNYNFYVEAMDNSSPASFQVLIDEELIIEEGAIQNTQIINLIPGKLYEIKVIAKDIESEFSIDWESIGFARNPISASSIYPAHSFDKFEASYLRLLKIISVIQNFNLSTDEFNYLAKNKEFQLSDGQPWLDLIPNIILERDSSADIDQRVSKLVSNFIGISNYVALKSMLNVADDQFIFLLWDVDSKDEKDQPLLNKITGWREQDLIYILDHFGLTKDDESSVGHLTYLTNFYRVSHVFEILQKLKISAESLVDSITNNPGPTELKTLQNALRARYEFKDWYRLIQPINDALRNLQRDALIAFVLNQFRSKPELAHINTADKLYEHFLIDVQRDACWKTSRIKEAISSVQLFVQRCLLNLEIGGGTDETQGVYPESIIGDRWHWMKRYRVWEANRKIFLYPENWAEPELRDNKSPAFRDLESELLQSDITEDSAARAYGHYLEKLEEVAKLEICGMYYEQHKPTELADDVVHVIARTSGARRTYYYRHQDGGMSWSPWEKIDVNIEDNPVLPVVWKGRLFLFWVSILQEGMDPDISGDDGTPASAASGTQLRTAAGEPRVRATATLYYSEYFNDKWQSPKTSDISNPVLIGEFIVAGAEQFNRRKLRLRSMVNNDQHLIVDLSYESLSIFDFKFYNTHSLPKQRNFYSYSFTESLRHKNKLTRWFSNSFHLKIMEHIYQETIEAGGRPRPGRRSRELLDLAILGDYEGHRIIQSRQPLDNIFINPFFYQDPLHVFYVTTSKRNLLTIVNPMIDLSTVSEIGTTYYELDEFVIVPELHEREIDKYATIGMNNVREGLINPGWFESHIGEVNKNISKRWNTDSSIQYGERTVHSDTSVITKLGS